MRHLVTRRVMLALAFLAFVATFVCMLAVGRAEPAPREFGRNPAKVDPAMTVIDTPPAPDPRAESKEALGAFTTATPEEVDAAIAIILKKEPRHHLMQDTMSRMALAERIVEVADYYSVPPLLVTVIMFRESGFNEKAIGKRGELGLMQVAKGNVAKFECDMSTAVGQMQCGTHMLRMQFDKCGDWTGALTSYATTTGACRSSEPQVQSKVKLRLRDWQRLSIGVRARLYEQGDEE